MNLAKLTVVGPTVLRSCVVVYRLKCRASRFAVAVRMLFGPCRTCLTLREITPPPPDSSICTPTSDNDKLGYRIGRGCFPAGGAAG